MTTNAMIFSVLAKICYEYQTFSQKLVWPGLYGPSGVSTTLHFHSLDPYGGYSRVWSQLIWFHHTNRAFSRVLWVLQLCLCPKSLDKTAHFKDFAFITSCVGKKRYIIVCGFMTTNAMTFGPDLLMSTKLSASRSPKVGMAWPLWAIRSQHHSS
jgi:hypothetical protein